MRTLAARFWQVLAVLRAPLYWCALLAACALTIHLLRYRAAPTATCLPIPTPVRAQLAAPSGGPAVPVERYDFRFAVPQSQAQPLAVTIGAALPFHQLMLNGADLTPEADLHARDLRDLAPHLHPLPATLLKARGNLLQLTLPALDALGPTRLEHVCIGALAELQPAFNANWWRMVGLPRICLLLLIALTLLAIALWVISGRHPSYLWYGVCLAPLLERCLYLSMPFRPGGPQLWIWLDDAALLMLPYALYRLMYAHWRFTSGGLRGVVRLGIAAALLVALARGFALPDQQPALEAAFVLVVLLSALATVLTVLGRASSMHRVERRVVTGVLVFAFVVALPEIGYFLLPFEQRWMWSAPPATVVLALGLGYLLVRRMAISEYVMAAATAGFAGELDQAIADKAAPTPRLWARVSADISQRERRRVIRDIHDGFGSRLVGVLSRARHELADPSLQVDIQRALLDMRLMIDAMDDASHSLGSALARLRHRIEQSQPQAAQRCHWQVAHIDDVVIGDRNRLVVVYRCIEELLSDRLARDGGTEVSIQVQTSRRRARFVLCGGHDHWSATTIDRVHRMVRLAQGDFALQPAHAGQAQCSFSVPLF